MKHMGLVVLILAARAAAGEAGLVLEIRDAETGKPLADLQCGLVEPVAKDVYASFKGNRYDGERVPRLGDVLYVYRRGYDLLSITLTEGMKVVEGSLTPCADFTTIVLEGEGTEELDYEVQVLVYIHELKPHSPIKDRYTLEGRGSGLRIPMPRGMRVSPAVEPAFGILWPHFVPAPRNRPHVLRFDPPRMVKVLLDDGVRPASDVEMLPDRFWSPDIDPLRLDAWRLHFGPDWLEKGLFRPEPALEVLPPAPFHCFVRLGGVPVYRYVGEKQDILDLRGPHRLKRVTGRPVVDGAPVREGTLMAPGRLDPQALAMLHESNLGCYRADFADEPWPEVRLPLSDVLTVWHREKGMAYLEWPDDGAPTGKTFPGLILVTAPDGWTADGCVSVYPVWRSTGRTRAVPPETQLQLHFDGKDRLRFPGLRPGRYGLYIQVALTGPDGQRVEDRGPHELDVPADHPTVVYRLNAR